MAKVKLKLLRPAYYDRFRCTGPECEDHCCKMWTIPIDRRTYMKYRSIRDRAFAEHLPERVKRLHEEGVRDFHYAEIVMDERTGCCKFFRADGLCEIQARYGEGYLSDTCANYPRGASEVLDSVAELSLSMVCPAAQRLALFSEEPMPFLFDETEVEENDRLLTMPMTKIPKGAALREYAFDIREAVVDLLQDRGLLFQDRLFAAGMLLTRLDEMAKQNDCADVPETIAQYRGAAAKGQLKGAGEKLAVSEDITAVFWQNLILAIRALNQGRRFGSAVYERLYGVISGWGSDESGETDYKKTGRRLRELIEEYWMPFMEERGYIVENYFVNLVFASRFPFQYAPELSVYEHFVILAEQYAALRLLACAGAKAEGGITDSLICSVLALMSAASQHGDTAKKIAETYIKGGGGALQYLVFLFRDRTDPGPPESKQ